MSGTQAVEVMIFGTGGFVGSLMFTVQSITVGRDPAAMVRLDDPSVSLKHALLVLEAGSLRVKDLGSRTGTRVNGMPVPSEPLKATDEIGVGTFRLRFTIHKASADASGPMPSFGGGLPTPMEPIVVARPQTAPLVEPVRLARPQTAVMDHARAAPPPPAVPLAPLPALPSPGPAASAYTRPPVRESWDNEETLVVKNAAVKALFAETDAPRTTGASPGAAIVAPPAAPVTPRSVDPLPAHSSPAARPDPRETAAELVPVVIERAHYSGDEDEDDEDDDANFVPPFDLLGLLSRGGLAAGAPGDPALAAVEVIHFRHDRVLSVGHLASLPLRLPGGATDVGARASDGAFVVYPKACPGPVGVRQAGSATTTPLTEPTFRLAAGTQVLIDLGSGEGLLVHMVPRAPALAPPRTSLKPSFDGVAPPALSAGLHVLISLLIGLVILGGKVESAEDVNAGRFATIDMKEIELEPPPPKPPEPDPPPTADLPTTPEPPTPMQNLPHSHAPKNAKAPRGAQAAAGGQPSASAQKILSALGAAAGPSSALNAAAITNLDAVPHGTGGFKVSGVVGKAPGDTLRVSAGGGDGVVNTKSASEIGNSVGRVTAHGGDGTVRGRVTTAPPAIQGEGHLDRGEIQRVINGHIYQVQGCYERQLMKDPSLSGKVSFQWLITPSGAVSGVRIGQSTLRSVEATTCIQSAIAGWKFPQPQGGSVTVTYPFSFIGN